MLPSSVLARQISVWSTSTGLSVPSGISPTEATRTLAKARLQLVLDHRARLLERDAVEHLAEEALHEHPPRRSRGDSARLQIEQVVRVDRPDRRAVRTADVVIVDLEHRDAGRLRLVGKHEVAVRLVGVRSRRSLLDADEAGVHSARHVLQRALEQQIGRCVADLMVLQRMKVEELLARGEVDAL